MIIHPHDHVDTAAQLSRPCGLLYSVWLANRSSLCTELTLEYHPLRCKVSQPTWDPIDPLETSPRMINPSLWEDAMKL
jgi:hypothetical protein